MTARAIFAAVAGLVAVPALFLGLRELVVGYNNLVRESAENRIRAELSRQEAEYEEKLRTLREERAEAHLESRRTALEAEAEMQRRLRDLEQQYERRARENPAAVGDRVYRDVQRVMCEVEAGADRDSVAACAERAAAAGDPEVSMAVTVTADYAEFLREVCDAYDMIGRGYTREEVEEQYPNLSEDDACHWEITGFTRRGLFDLLAWMKSVQTYALLLRRSAEGDRDLHRELYEEYRRTFEEVVDGAQ